jgi:aspartate aminotransferase
MREAIAQKLKKDNGLDVNSKAILVTPGAKQAIFAACFSRTEAGGVFVTKVKDRSA